MAHSINYYVPLSDELSIAIDAMSADELITLAGTLLFCRSVLNNLKSFERFQEVYAQETLEKYGVTCKGAVTLAHGLLAKAI